MVDARDHVGAREVAHLAASCENIGLECLLDGITATEPRVLSVPPAPVWRAPQHDVQPAKLAVAFWSRLKHAKSDHRFEGNRDPTFVRVAR